MGKNKQAKEKLYLNNDPFLKGRFEYSEEFKSELKQMNLESRKLEKVMTRQDIYARQATLRKKQLKEDL